MTRAIVIGGGLSGVLAATALSHHVDQVTVIESDKYPEQPAPRRGMPQGRQNHMLTAGGAAALDQLLPGTTDLLFAAGAHKLAMGRNILTLSSEGWFRKVDDDAFFIACSRNLLDHVVRQQALTNPVITVLQETKATGLLGTASRVTGIRYEQGTEPEQTLTADLVVDATGSRSKTPQWLTEIGVPALHEEFLDAGLAYAGRLYEAPAEAAADFPGVLIQTVPNTGQPGAGAAFMPQENGRWIVSLIGTAGGQPPTGEDGFMEFARNVGHPIVAELMARATPIGEIKGSRGLANRRRYFERLPLPEGFLALGDAVTVLSPNYASGMSMAAFGALALRSQLKSHGLEPGLGKKVQLDIANKVAGPWKSATSTDRWFPGVRTNIKLGKGTVEQKLAVRWSRTAAEHPGLLKATYQVATLQTPQNKVMTLPLMGALLRGPQQAPLTPAQALAQFPQLGRLLDSAPADLSKVEH
ncbi:FAD-dependent monooxygenase [Kitasatospora sp. CMC57]|uniref:FAD-dependent monooxygenase n=1 Tax=Kitasatospora sp. CMC57 TaxID=3231513 RepID=A0AB33JPW2_9ACTN